MQLDNESVDGLRNDVVARWRNEFGESHKVEAASALGERVVFSKYPVYDIKNYTPLNFRAGGRTWSEPLPGQENFLYRLDNKGRPVYMSSASNPQACCGAYTYSHAGVTAVQYLNRSFVPHQYDRVTMAGDTRLSFQRLIVNGGTYQLASKQASPDAAADLILKNNHGYYIWVEKYEVDNGLTRSGRVLTEGSGSPDYPRQYSTLSYTYSPDGTLERIVQESDWGGKQTIYAAPTKTSPRKLAEALANRLAERVISELRKSRFAGPLVAVELPYIAVQHYVPAIIVGTVEDRISDLNLTVAIDSERWIQLPDEDFEPELTELLQRIEPTDQFEIVTKMLRRAAAIVTERVPQEVPAVEDFIAFAIDWEAEGHELVRVLKDCGAKSQWIAQWRKRGWL